MSTDLLSTNILLIKSSELKNFWIWILNLTKAHLSKYPKEVFSASKGKVGSRVAPTNQKAARSKWNLTKIIIIQFVTFLSHLIFTLARITMFNSVLLVTHVNLGSANPLRVVQTPHSTPRSTPRFSEKSVSPKNCPNYP